MSKWPAVHLNMGVTRGLLPPSKLFPLLDQQHQGAEAQADSVSSREQEQRCGRAEYSTNLSKGWKKESKKTMFGVSTASLVWKVHRPLVWWQVVLTGLVKCVASILAFCSIKRHMSRGWIIDEHAVEMDQASNQSRARRFHDCARQTSRRTQEPGCNDRGGLSTSKALHGRRVALPVSQRRPSRFK